MNVIRKALVTLAVGPAYAGLFERYARPSWQRYAERHGYTLHVIGEPLDGSARARQRSVAWQSLLVLSQPWSATYDQIVFADCDIVINVQDAPCIVGSCPAERVGVADERGLFGPILADEIDRRLESRLPDLAGITPEAVAARGRERDPYRAFGLPKAWPHRLNCGVLVASPRHHRGLFEHVYNTYEDKGGAVWNYHNWPLAHEIQEQKLLHLLDPRFNLILFLFNFLAAPHAHAKLPTMTAAAQAARSALLASYFLHFAGLQDFMPLLGPFIDPSHDGPLLIYDEALRGLQGEVAMLASLLGRAGP